MQENKTKHKTTYKVCVDYVGTLMTHEFYGTMKEQKKDDPHVCFETDDGMMMYRASDIVFMRRTDTK